MLHTSHELQVTPNLTVATDPEHEVDWFASGALVVTFLSGCTVGLSFYSMMLGGYKKTTEL
jgi:hypothetical protein